MNLVRDIIRKSAGYLAAAGLQAARLEAELLVGYALGLDRTQLYVQYDRPVGPDELATIRALLLRRVKDRVPIAYLTGSKVFYGLTILTPPGVFIPRPETEEMVAAAVDMTTAETAVSSNQFLPVLDLCAGTGAVGLAIAHKIAAARILAVDIDPAAIAATTANATALGLASRTDVRQGDLWQAVPTEARFALIAANPPYIPHGRLADLPAEVRRHEPPAALDGGEDGLTVAARIIERVGDYLLPRGLFALEHGDDQGEALLELARRAGLTDLAVHQDLSGRPRYLTGRRSASA